MEKVPHWVKEVLDTLEQQGKQAYLVGGCVRDLLMGRSPQDWDVTTDALPEEVMAAFPGKTIPTGLQHGTVTVRSEHHNVEVTTFRKDGDYLDGRHPSSVEFTSALEEDLSRRDFTVNAMAMDLRGSIRDPFGGQQDLKAGLLRCVGQPDRRFGEDALRLMRALRFAATLGFAIEEETARSIHRNAALLQRIAAERILQEMTKLICGKYMLPVLLEYPDVLTVFWPEIAPTVGFDQRNHHHCYSVWEHTVRAMEQIEPDPVLRYTMLFHDLGKPGSFVSDASGEGHFYGHAALSARLAEDMMQRLRFDKASQKRIALLVKWHDDRYPMTRRNLLGLLQKLGPKATRQLLAVKRADNMAKAPKPRYFEMLDEAQQTLQQLLEEGACYHISHLAVSGSDLQRLGYAGPAIAVTLQRLLLQVMDGKLPNEKEVLCAYAEKIKER